MSIARFDVQLIANDDEVTIFWRIDGRPIGRKSVSTTDITDCSNRVRAVLNKITSYVRHNSSLSKELDDDFKEYSRLLDELRVEGFILYELLLPPNNKSSGAQPVQYYLKGAESGSLIDVFVDDQNTTIPLGFAYAGRRASSKAVPSFEDFDGFWLSHFRITTWLAGVTYNPAAQSIPSSNFRALFAVDENEWDDVFDDKVFCEFSKVFDLKFGVRTKWSTAGQTWKDMDERKFDSVLFFLGHSNGRNLTLSGEERPGYHLKNLFSKSQLGSNSIIIANACMSLAGNPAGGSSLLSLAAQEGFCGLIGAEAEILNTKALLCGAHVVKGLCMEGLSFGESFDRMRSDKRLFPLNLFYSCYGDRDFRLDKPVDNTTEQAYEDAGQVS